MLGDHRVTFSGMQAPFAAGRRIWDTTQNRLTKHAAYEQLEAWATERAAQDTALVLGMDGNNTRDWIDPSADRPRESKKRRSDARRWLDEADLFAAEDAFHGARSGHGLIDTLRQAAQVGAYIDPHGSQPAARLLDRPLAVTYRLKRDAHRMDRIYVSTTVNVKAAGVCHDQSDPSDVREATSTSTLCCGSDHALVWADLEFGS